MKDTVLFKKAFDFALKVHGNAFRKNEEIPYIIHPMEVATIVATMTDDESVIAAALLHDTIEDAGVTYEELKNEFGQEVADLVRDETEDKLLHLPKADTWMVRKIKSLEVLEKSEDPKLKMLWLGDKVSNMRSFHRSYLKEGNALWERFNQKDPSKQAWYYKKISEYTVELADTAAWKEYNYLIETVFEGILYEY